LIPQGGPLGRLGETSPPRTRRALEGFPSNPGAALRAAPGELELKENGEEN